MPEPSTAPSPGPSDPIADPRPVAPGGWRRAVVGFVVGLLAGAAVALALPRDDGPRRRHPRPDDDGPPDPSIRG